MLQHNYMCRARGEQGKAFICRTTSGWTRWRKICIKAAVSEMCRWQKDKKSETSLHFPYSFNCRTRQKLGGQLILFLPFSFFGRFFHKKTELKLSHSRETWKQNLFVMLLLFSSLPEVEVDYCLVSDLSSVEWIPDVSRISFAGYCPATCLISHQLSFLWFLW